MISKKIKTIYARTQFWFELSSGGSVGHTLGVLHGLKNKGICLKILSNESFYGIEEFDHDVLPPVIKSPQWFGELLYNFISLRRYRKKILKYKPDFIYHRYSGYTFFISRLSSQLKIPLILEFNSFDSWKLVHWEKSRNPVKRFFQKVFLYRTVKRIENYNLEKAALVITVSEPLREDLVRAGVPEGKILINPNGFDQERFKPGVTNSSKCKAIRNKVGADKIVIGFCGTFGAWHGIPQLTDAIDRILNKKMLKNAHFLIMGDGGKLKGQMVDKLSKYPEVTFTGNIPYSEIHYYLAACDILVSPHNPPADSRDFFGSPTKIFEYMGIGKGIIASDLGQIGKILKHRETALLTPPGDIEALVEGILELAGDESLRQELGRKASVAVLREYTWNKNVERFLKRSVKP